MVATLAAWRASAKGRGLAGVDEALREREAELLQRMLCVVRVVAVGLAGQQDVRRMVQVVIPFLPWNRTKLCIIIRRAKRESSVVDWMEK